MSRRMPLRDGPSNSWLVKWAQFVPTEKAGRVSAAAATGTFLANKISAPRGAFSNKKEDKLNSLRGLWLKGREEATLTVTKRIDSGLSTLSVYLRGRLHEECYVSSTRCVMASTPQSGSEGAVALIFSCGSSSIGKERTCAAQFKNAGEGRSCFNIIKEILTAKARMNALTKTLFSSQQADLATQRRTLQGPMSSENVGHATARSMPETPPSDQPPGLASLRNPWPSQQDLATQRTMSQSSLPSQQVVLATQRTMSQSSLPSQQIDLATQRTMPLSSFLSQQVDPATPRTMSESSFPSQQVDPATQRTMSQSSFPSQQVDLATQRTMPQSSFLSQQVDPATPMTMSQSSFPSQQVDLATQRTMLQPSSQSQQVDLAAVRSRPSHPPLPSQQADFASRQGLPRPPLFHRSNFSQEPHSQSPMTNSQRPPCSLPRASTAMGPPPPVQSSPSQVKQPTTLLESIAASPSAFTPTTQRRPQEALSQSSQYKGASRSEHGTELKDEDQRRMASSLDPGTSSQAQGRDWFDTYEALGKPLSSDESQALYYAKNKQRKPASASPSNQDYARSGFVEAVAVEVIPTPDANPGLPPWERSRNREGGLISDLNEPDLKARVKAILLDPQFQEDVNELQAMLEEIEEESRDEIDKVESQRFLEWMAEINGDI